MKVMDDYTSGMILMSESGYCMPFEDRDGNVDLVLAYGEQVHPETGEKFFHHGVDFKTYYYLLPALADGKVVGIGNDVKYELHLLVQYGKYVVKYGHLSSVNVLFGQPVRAGLPVGVSGELLHMEVYYDEQEIDPIDFVTMLYSNVVTAGKGIQAGQPIEFVTLDMDVPTKYDHCRDEVEQLMLRYYPAYMEELRKGSYVVSEHTEQSLRNVFTVTAIKNYFFENIPSLANPLGVGKKAAPVVAKVQNLLIADFLNYLAVRQHVFLSGLSEDEKKK